MGYEAPRLRESLRSPVAAGPWERPTQAHSLSTIDAISGINEASNAPDWLIDLSRPVHQPMRDPRLDNARAALIETQVQLIALDTAAKQVEAVLRDCAEIGMTSDEIAVQISLSMEVVERVLNGGSLLGLDYD